MGFEMLMDMLALKAKKNGVDLIVMENALGITQHNNSDSSVLIARKPLGL